MTWGVTLEGGPFDKDKGTMSDTALPSMMWVEPCDRCTTHWFSDWVAGAEVYVLKESSIDRENSTATYVYEDTALDPAQFATEKELVPA